jgi:ribonuclease P protein component
MSGIVGKISKFTKREIDYLFSNARRVVRNQFCTILVAKRQKEDFGRVLVVVSRAVGNAPERNLIRRRIKSVFYEEKLFEHNFDCVVIAHKKMVSISFEQLKDMLVSAYQKILNEISQ